MAEPELLLVFAPVRCHLGFPAWRMRYTEIMWVSFTLVEILGGKLMTNLPLTVTNFIELLQTHGRIKVNESRGCH